MNDDNVQEFLESCKLQKIQRKIMDEKAETLIQKDPEWIIQLNNAYKEEFQHNTTTEYPCKISMLYILHSYFLKAKNQLANQWTETVTLIFLQLIDLNKDQRYLQSLSKLVKKWESEKVFDSLNVNDWLKMIEVACESKQSEESITSSNLPIKRNVSNIDNGTNIDDDHERHDLKRQKLPIENHFEAHTTTSSSSTVSSQNPFPTISSSISEQKPIEMRVKNTKQEHISIHKSTSSNQINKTEAIHSSFTSSMVNNSCSSISISNTSKNGSIQSKNSPDFSTEIKECFIKCRSFMSKLLFERLFTVQNDKQQQKERQSYALYRQLTAHTILSSHSILYKFMRYRKDNPPTQSELPAIVIASIFLAGKAEYFFNKLDKLIQYSSGLSEECFGKGTVFPTRESILEMEQKILWCHNYNLAMECNPLTLISKLLDTKRIDSILFLHTLQCLCGDKSIVMFVHKNFERPPECMALTALLMACPKVWSEERSYALFTSLRAEYDFLWVEIEEMLSRAHKKDPLNNEIKYANKFAQKLSTRFKESLEI